MFGFVAMVGRVAQQVARTFGAMLSASHPVALARRVRWALNPPKSSFEGADNYLLALPRELRDRVYEYHIHQLTFNYISNPTCNHVTNLTQTELHFIGHMSGAGLDTNWRAFKEARGLHPLSDGYDPQVSPELEQAYLRTSTFHTAVKLAADSKGVKSSLLKCLENIGRGAAGQICNLQLRILTYSPESYTELICNPDALHDADFATMVAEERLDQRNEMRHCAARLAKLLRAYRFCGRLGLVGQYMGERGVFFSATVMKKGLEVADAALRKGMDWKDVIQEVLVGEEMDALVRFSAEPTVTVVTSVNTEIEWCFVNVDFSKE
ncbi:hypothetical protein SLS58_007370 [Diplodia intermedia]|uniref:Uncharacterized protein n=1 Tax=Diplodia intermedia TaxID=856260 RepID=A0ABR3TK64_9PEZI